MTTPPARSMSPDGTPDNAPLQPLPEATTDLGPSIATEPRDASVITDETVADEALDTSWASQPPLVREGFPILFLVILALLLTWNRAVYDWWLGRHDILAYWLPTNDLLGSFLRNASLPGWDPHRFSGTPFAADPESGWGSFPIMVPFTLIPNVLTAYKVKVGIDMVVAVVSTYAFARCLGIRQLGSMLAAIVFTFGPLSYNETHCCTVRAALALTLPLAFLGIEILFRATTWRARIGGFAAASFAYSQAWAAFPGQGAMDATLLLIAWTLYRGIIGRPEGGMPPRGMPWRDRIIQTAIVGATVFPFGLILDIGALWPRLEFYQETTLGTHGYGNVTGYTVGGYDLPGLLRRLILDYQHSRDIMIASGAIVLGLLAPVIARTRFAVPFFAGMTLVILELSMAHSYGARVLGLLPGWSNFHEHNVPMVFSILMIGPAILAGATLDQIMNLRGRIGWQAVVIAPFVLILLCYIVISQARIPLTFTPLWAAGLVTILLLLIVDDRWTKYVRRPGRIVRLIPVAIIIVVYMQPMGLELVDGVIGKSMFIKAWDEQLNPSSAHGMAADQYVESRGPGLAGTYLMNQRDAGNHFRYVGYIATGIPDTENRNNRGTQVQRRYDANTRATQANGRSVYLNLYETQGYNPLYLSRYFDLMSAINGASQDYHFADLHPTTEKLSPMAVRFGLLDILNVEYLLVDRKLPSSRPDVVAVVQNWQPVYQDNYVTIYQNPDNLGPAWIVHDVRQISQKDAINALRDRYFRPATTALVEGEPPPVAATGNPATDSVSLTSFAPSRVTYDASTQTDSFLVMSEIYEKGWHAYLDGKRVPLYATDLALRGISLPAGAHRVELRYEPLSLRLGFVMSVVAHVVLIGALIGVFIAPRGRGRRPGRALRSFAVWRRRAPAAAAPGDAGGSS